MKIMDFEGTGIVVLSDDDAQAPKHVGDTHRVIPKSTSDWLVKINALS